MLSIKEIVRLSNQISGKGERRRKLVSVIRFILNKKYIQELREFFGDYPLLKGMWDTEPDLYSIINRNWWYKSSTSKTRLQMFKNHFLVLQDILSETQIQQLYLQEGFEILNLKEYGINATLNYDHNQKKEGLLTLTLNCGDNLLFLMNFCFTVNEQKEHSIFIGTLQGGINNLEESKKLTKKMHGYRPKNLIIYILRILSSKMNIKKIYAISDQEFYANAHIIRFNRIKKTSLNLFWLEINGIIANKKPLFFDIPVLEYRKPIEEVKSKKRNMYRKRYDLLDYIETQIRI